MLVITEVNIKRVEVNMGSIHFFAVMPEEKLAEGPWFEHRGSRMLTDEEQEKIMELSGRLETRTHAWVDEVNISGEWKKYYEDRFHRWFEQIRKANGEEIEPATELYLHAGFGELYCTGVEETVNIFFGFLNLDDIECDFDVVLFLREYVRRLSIIMPDLLWLFDYRGEAYYRGVPIIVKGKGTKYPMRSASRKEQIPRYVKEALGPTEAPPPDICFFCGKADRKATPQYLNKLFNAHERCFLDFYKSTFELEVV